MWPNFEENPEAIVVQRLHAIGETDRLAHVSAPVDGVRGLAVRQRAADEVPCDGMAGGDIVTFRASASMRSSAGSMSGECAASDTYSRCPTTLRFANAVSTVSTARASPEMTTLSGPLTAAMATRSLNGAIAASNVLDRGEQRRHHASRRQALHQPPAPRDESQPILERKHAGRAGRGIFADGMPNDRRGGHSP